MPSEPKPKTPLVAMAIGAHPDDIEFMMAGTLLRLKSAGAEIHMWNLTNGSCGTAVYSYDDIVRLRGQEAKDSAAVARAVIHEPLVDDLDVYYEREVVAKVAAVIRQVKPSILLVPSPNDYMEDHQNTCRLAVTGAFERGMPNFRTDPPVDHWPGDVVLYHAVPHGLRDGLGKKIHSGHYVDIGPTLEVKRKMLACHRTQQQWLDTSQGMNAYIQEMESMCGEVGRMSGKFELAEGWRKHNTLGFAPAGADPLKEALGEACWIDPDYERHCL